MCGAMGQRTESDHTLTGTERSCGRRPAGAGATRADHALSLIHISWPGKRNAIGDMRTLSIVRPGFIVRPGPRRPKPTSGVDAGAGPFAPCRNPAGAGSTFSVEWRAGLFRPVPLCDAAGRCRSVAARGRLIHRAGMNYATSRELFEFERQCRVSALKELSDEELYRLMRKGNQLAFAQLYERRQPAIYRYALHMSGRDVYKRQAQGLLRDEGRQDLPQ